MVLILGIMTCVVPTQVDYIVSMLAELIGRKTLKQTQIYLLLPIIVVLTLRQLLLCGGALVRVLVVHLLLISRWFPHLPHLKTSVFSASRQIVPTRAELCYPNRVGMRVDLLHSIQV